MAKKDERGAGYITKHAKLMDRAEKIRDFFLLADVADVYLWEGLRSTFLESGKPTIGQNRSRLSP